MHIFVRRLYRQCRVANGHRVQHKEQPPRRLNTKDAIQKYKDEVLEHEQGPNPAVRITYSEAVRKQSHKAQ